MKYDINELYPSARHAYISTGLAVKTGRPQYVNELLCCKELGVPLFAKGSGLRQYTVLAFIPNANLYFFHPLGQKTLSGQQS